MTKNQQFPSPENPYPQQGRRAELIDEHEVHGRVDISLKDSLSTLYDDPDAVVFRSPKFTGKLGVDIQVGKGKTAQNFAVFSGEMADHSRATMLVTGEDTFRFLTPSEQFEFSKGNQLTLGADLDTMTLDAYGDQPVTLTAHIAPKQAFEQAFSTSRQ